MEPPVIVTLTGFADIFEQFKESVEKYEPESERIVVTSRGLRLRLTGWQWRAVRGLEPFVFARNANIGIREAEHRDVFLVNDDVQFLRSGSLANLQKIAYSCPHIGILSPQFQGRVGSAMQRVTYPIAGTVAYSGERLCFTGVYLKCSVLDQIGELDERFFGYGGDDDDYSWRVQAAGLKLAVTPSVVMQHGFKDLLATTSFERTNARDFRVITEQSTALLREKWPGRAV